MTTRVAPQTRRGPIYPVYVPDTTTPAVLMSELFEADGPHSDYADQWVRVGGLHAALPQQATLPHQATVTAA